MGEEPFLVASPSSPAERVAGGISSEIELIRRNSIQQPYFPQNQAFENASLFRMEASNASIEQLLLEECSLPFDSNITPHRIAASRPEQTQTSNTSSITPSQPALIDERISRLHRPPCLHPIGPARSSHEAAGELNEKQNEGAINTEMTSEFRAPNANGVYGGPQSIVEVPNVGAEKNPQSEKELASFEAPFDLLENLHRESAERQSDMENESCLPSQLPPNLTQSKLTTEYLQSQSPNREFSSDEHLNQLKEETTIRVESGSLPSETNPENSFENSNSHLGPSDLEAQSINKHGHHIGESGSSFAGFAVDKSGDALLHAVVNEAETNTRLDSDEAIEQQLCSTAIPTSLVAVQFVSELGDFTETSSAITLRHVPAPHLSLAEPDIGADGALLFQPTQATTTPVTAPIQFSSSRFIASASEPDSLSGVFFDFSNFFNNFI